MMNNEKPGGNRIIIPCQTYEEAVKLCEKTQLQNPARRNLEVNYFSTMRMTHYQSVGIGVGWHKQRRAILHTEPRSSSERARPVRSSIKHPLCYTAFE